MILMGWWNVDNFMFHSLELCPQDLDADNTKTSFTEKQKSVICGQPYKTEKPVIIGH